MLHKAVVVPLRAPLQVEPLGLRVGIGSFADEGRAPGHRDVELNFVYSGGVRYFVGGRFVEVGAGQLSLFWGALPHRVSALEPSSEYMYAPLPLVSVLRYGLPSSFNT